VTPDSARRSTWPNRRERAEGIETLARNGVKIIATAGQDLDLSTSAGRVVAGVLGELDTHEVEQMSERIRDEQAQRAKAGLSRAACTTAEDWPAAYAHVTGATLIDLASAPVYPQTASAPLRLTG
jgi:DNA invertase Pin-like site-specific DNA recombinase